MNKNISFEVHNRIATLTINRPQNRNMLNKETRLELSSLLDSIQHDPNIGVLVVTGSGSEFFMSGDLEELSKMSSLELFEFLDTLGQRLYTRFEQVDIPVIAAINGLCLGAGVEIAMACDLDRSRPCSSRSSGDSFGGDASRRSHATVNETGWDWKSKRTAVHG